MASDDEEVYVESIDDRDWGQQWRQYSKANGKLDTIPSATHLRQFLAKLRIQLTEKSCQKLMVICKEKGRAPYVHLTTLKTVIREALDNYSGLPVDQAIGGLIVEFNASDAGRKHRNYQSMQSMQAIVAASTQSLSHYALSKVKESKNDKQKRKDQEKLKRQLKREKLHAQQQDLDYTNKPSLRSRSSRDRDNHSPRPKRNSRHLPDRAPVSDDDRGSDSYHHSPASSVVINSTPQNDASPDDFPNTGMGSRTSNDKLTLNTAAFNRIRSTSSDIGMQRRIERKRSKDLKLGNDDEKERKDDSMKRVSILELEEVGGATDASTSTSGVQQVVEILKRQENMLYRIQTQMQALERQIKRLKDDDEDIGNDLRDALLELEYLKTSSLNEIRNELSGLKMELFDGFECISISSAYNVSLDIKHSLHSMNNKISNSVRLWGNDWNIKKRMISNQQKLDHVLFKASKILRKYQEQQSNLKTIKGQNKDIKMNVPQFIAEMDSIRTSLKSMDHYLNTFVFDRLSRMENALVRIFQQSGNLADPDNTNANNRTVKRFSVDELMNQLDSQRLNFEGQLRAKSEKIITQKEELQLMKQIMDKERDKMDGEKEEFAHLAAKCEEEESNNKQLQFDLKAMKSQLERLSMFNNPFGTTNDTKKTKTKDDKEELELDANKYNKLHRTATAVIHPDIIAKADANELNPDVDLDLEFDKFYTNSLSSLIGDFIAKSKLDNREKANEFHKHKEGGHLRFSRDEVPKFLANKNNRDAQQQELEDRLGFGYQELYYLYRENTEINIRCNRLEHENKAVRRRLEAMEPVVIVENVANVSVQVQNELETLYKKLRDLEAQCAFAEDKGAVAMSSSKYIDKYRLEMLQDVKKVEQEIESQMNYDKFQFQRQRKKMNALMKSEKEGVLKEREIMEEERAEIEQVKAEWKHKLSELSKKEQEFDEKVVLAKTNMNFVVFQKGLTEALRDYKDDLKEELKEIAEQEMIKEETEEIRNESNEQIEKQREYYDGRYKIQTGKMNSINKENDSLKLQISHFKQQIKKIENEILLRDEHYEKVQGMYDHLELEYSFLKEQYKKLEKEKKQIISTSAADSKEEETTTTTPRKTKKKNKQQQARTDGKPLYLCPDSDDDEMIIKEKEALGEWLKQRRLGNFASNSNRKQRHWLVLPQDELAGKDRDIEDLNRELKQLRQTLDAKGREIGKYKQIIEQYKKKQSGTADEDKVLNKLSNKHSGIVREFDEHIDTVKRWLKVWQDGIKTVTKAETKWMEKNSELIKKEKEIQKEKEDLIYDQRMWYAHKNHILRRFYYFTKQCWWQRFAMHEFQKSRVDQELAWHKPHGKDGKLVDHRDCFLWNQYFKMMLETWFETGVYQHALTRWFCQYNTYSKEKDLFHYGDNDNNEELYVFKEDVMHQIGPHLDSIVERYYRLKWMKRKQKFGRVWITAEKPTIVIDAGFKSQKKITRDLLNLLHKKEPGFHTSDIKCVIKNAMQEMDRKIKGFNRSAWDMVKTLDGVGVVPLAQQNRSKTPRHSKRKSIKHSASASQQIEEINPLPSSIDINKTEVAMGDKTEYVSTPGGTKKRKRVRIAPKEIGRVSQTVNPKQDDDNKDDEKDEERMRRLKRASMKTPKASPGEKTWSHAMDNFKSVNKRNKKKMTAEEKEKLRQKRRKGGKSKKRSEKRSSVRNATSGLGLFNSAKHIKSDDQNNQKSPGIKSFQPDLAPGSKAKLNK